MKKMTLKKMFSAMVCLCMLLGSMGLQAAYADAVALAAQYGTNMTITASGSQDLTTLAEIDSDVDAGSAVFFSDQTETTTDGYIELDLDYVSEVEKLVLRSRGDLQRMVTAKITYLSETDGTWVTAYESTEASTYVEGDYNLYDKEISLNVTTARIRVYPLSTSNAWGQIRLDSLKAYGTAKTDTRMYGNVLYDTWVTWTGTENCRYGIVDGNFNYNGGDCACTMPSEGYGELTITWDGAKTIDYVELTHGYGFKSQGINAGYIEAINAEGVFEKVCDIDMTPVFTNETINREYTELPHSVTTTGLKIVVTNAMSNVVSFNQVIATTAPAASRQKLTGSIYSTTFNLYNFADSASNDIGRLRADKEPGDSEYNSNFNMVLFKNPANYERDFGEDYIDINLNAPSDVKQVVVYTRADDEEQKPKTLRIDYLDHNTQQWITAEDSLNVPVADETTTYNFPKTVYADAIRVYVLEMYSEFHIFRLQGLYAVGAERNERLNNGNVLKNRCWVNYGNGFDGSMNLNDGKLSTFGDVNASGVGETNPISFNYTINTQEVNRVEIICATASLGIRKGYIEYYDQEGYATGTAGWYKACDFEFGADNAQLGGCSWNPIKYVINLPQTVKTPYINVVVTEMAHSSTLRINEIIVKNAANVKTGYTVSDMSVNSDDASNVICTTDFEEFDGNGYFYDVIYAAYSADGTLLKSATSKPVDLTPFSKRKITGKLDLSGETGEIKIKRYIWQHNGLEAADGVSVAENAITIQE